MKKLVILLILAGAAFFGVRYYQARVQPARPVRGIEVSGTIETVETEASFQIAGKMVRLLVDEGDRVRKGQLIAVLDEEDLQKQRAAAKHALQAAQSQLPQLRSRVDLSQEQSAARVSQAQASVDEAQTRLRELENGSRPQEIQQARKDVEATRTTMLYLEKEYHRAERLYHADAMSGQQRDTAKSNYDVSLARYQQARERLSLVREGSRQEDIQAARERVRQAEAALALARTGPLETRTLQLQQRTLAEQTRQAGAALAYAETQLAHTRLFAPVAGIVLVKGKESGEVVSPGVSVVTLGDLDHVWLKAYIGETDLGRVKLGQVVEVTTDSHPSKTYRGRIYYIASQAEFTPKNLQTKEDRVKLVYRIKVALENPDQELKPGMIADGVILAAPGDAPGGSAGRPAEPAASPRGSAGRPAEPAASPRGSAAAPAEPAGSGR